MGWRPRLFVVGAALPILLGLWLAHTTEVDSLDASFLDGVDSESLNLLQKRAKAIEGSRKVIGYRETREESRESSGVASNNYKAFVLNISVDFIVVIACLIVFKLALNRYPIMMKYRFIQDESPILAKSKDVPDGFFGWAVASWNVTLDQCWDCSTLDSAMMLEFLNLCITTLKWIALPLFFITGPLNWQYGGNAAGSDYESYFSLWNVRIGSWLYWVSAVAVWWVVWNVTRMCHIGMRRLLDLRLQWFLSLQPMRANTLLMTNIPEEYQSDEQCKHFWDSIIPGGKIESVTLTKDTSGRNGLYRLYAQILDQRYHLSLARKAWRKDKEEPDKRPKVRASTFGDQKDAIEHYSAEISKLVPQIEMAREKLDIKAQEVSGVNLHTGFITFRDRRDAEKALRMVLSKEVKHWNLENAPAPVDVIWADMTQDPGPELGRAVVGYVMLLFVVFIYLPIVTFFAGSAVYVNAGWLQPLWNGMVPGLGVAIMMNLLPTALNAIFSNFFTFYSKSRCQYNTSVWYWWLLVWYAIIVTSFGTMYVNFYPVIERAMNNPWKLCSLFAEFVPSCCHYFLCFVGIQFMFQALSLTRYYNLFKFFLCKSTLDEQDARDMSEPENQDYYGIGSRTAMWSIMMCIGIVFGTLSPPLSMLTLFFMIFARLVHGYLFCYAEVRKPDLGGVFFYRALRNMFVSCHIYMIVMIPMLLVRGPGLGPGVIAICAWFYVYLNQRQFNNYQWEFLPYPELVNNGSAPITRNLPALIGTYVQPELAPIDYVEGK